MKARQPMSAVESLLAEEAVSGTAVAHANDVLAVAASAVPLPSAYSSEGGFVALPPHEVAERLATGQLALLLDVRSEEEFNTQGHITGATNVPLDALSTAVLEGGLDQYRTRPVAVVCAGGMRSAQATVRLTKVLGFTNVANLEGGMAAWTREGLPMQLPMADVLRQYMQQAAQQPKSGGCGCGSSSGGGGGGCKSGSRQ